jgi:hypothetical protein
MEQVVVHRKDAIQILLLTDLFLQVFHKTIHVSPQIYAPRASGCGAAMNEEAATSVSFGIWKGMDGEPMVSPSGSGYRSVPSV